MLVTDLDDGVAMISKTYRQRGNCENIYDEMKNQWGWGGFNSHKLSCTAIAAGMTAIVANWWNVFCRLGEDGVHREAITSRPLLQRCVASIMVRSRQKIVTLYMKGKEKTCEIFSKIHTYLSGVSSATQLKPEERWMQVLDHAFRQYDLKKTTVPTDSRRPIHLESLKSGANRLLKPQSLRTEAWMHCAKHLHIHSVSSCLLALRVNRPEANRVFMRLKSNCFF